MSWFDEQLRYRREKDNENFSDAIRSVADAVMGRRLSQSLDSGVIAQSAIEEVLRYFHLKSKPVDLPSQINTLDEQLEYRLRPFGIMRRTVTLDKGWYKNAIGPMLGFLKEDGTVVALIPGRLSGYSYIDRKTGKKVWLNRKNENLLTNEAICFYKPLPMKSLTIADLLKFMAEQLSISDFVMYIGMMAVTALLGLLSPVFTKWLFSSVLESKSTTVLLALAGFMVSFMICRLLVSSFQSLIMSRVGVKQNIAVQSAVMNRIMSLPASFFKNYASGELTQRSIYVQSLCETMMNTIGSTGIASVFSLIYIGQIFVYAPALVIPSLLVTIITMLLSITTTIVQMKLTKEKMLLASKSSGLTYSMITGIQKIKLAGAEKRAFSLWAKNYSEDAVLDYNPPLFIKLSGTLRLTVSLIGSLVLFYFAVKSQVSVSDYYAFNSAYAMISGAFMSFANIAISVANIKPSLEMSMPIMETEPEMTDGKEIITSLKGAIEINNLSFRYNDDMPNVIDDLSLKIKPGEYVAIVGKTGCGKTTLMRLLLGMEKPQKGSIYYDRKDITRVDLKSLRRKMGVVMQNSKLFLGDIYSNIVIASPQLTLDDAWEAAKIASIDKDIEAMPMGMHTIISEGNGGISGGQRQRIMIARAVAPKPKIIMFDEATSALDNVTQRKVSEAIDSLNCTRIVIAHRLSTIRHCDRIIALDEGRIVEDGTYDELIARNGFFAQLVERQRLELEQ